MFDLLATVGFMEFMSTQLVQFWEYTGIANFTLGHGAMILIGLASFGIKQNNFVTSPVWFAVTAVIILGCAVVTAFLSGRGITRLEPVKILKEE